MSTTENRRVVQAFFEALANFDVAKIDGLLAQNATWRIAHSTPVSGTYDRAGFLKNIESFKPAAAAPFLFDFADWTAEGDRVALTAKGHLPLQNGKIYASDYHFMFRVRDGKIEQGQELFDSAHLCDCFDLTPAPA
nr:nuclear transport factor 2 family protein [Sphingomonas sp. CDS-1]